MTKVIIRLNTVRVLRDFFLEKQLDLVREELPHYTVGGTFETYATGIDAAEEAFDLTNNPDRRAEREEIYGCGRSVCAGDVIEVDGVKYACMPFGWGEL